MHLTQKTLQVDGERLVCEFAIRKRTAVILHGAGTSSRKRMYNLARALLEQNVGVVLFDFSGHGDSSGKLTELSLARRQLQAQAVIDSLVPPNIHLYLMGFSMGAQTVCDILPYYASRVASILLGCPAMYSQVVHDLPFGAPTFTAILRTAESWAKSKAPARLAAYQGPVIVAIGTEDNVIPKGVVERYKQAARRLKYIEYRGVDHRLSSFLNSDAVAAKGIVAALLESPA